MLVGFIYVYLFLFTELELLKYHKYLKRIVRYTSGVIEKEGNGTQVTKRLDTSINANRIPRKNSKLCS